MSDNKNDKIISAILRSSDTEAAAADLKIGMVNIKLTAEAPSDVDRVKNISNFLSVPEKKKDDPNFKKRPRILVCFFSYTDPTKDAEFKATLEGFNSQLTSFEVTPFKENIYIYLNKKEEVKAVDKSFTVGDHTIYINDTDAELVVSDYKEIKTGNIILNNNTETAPTPPSDSFPLKNAPSPDKTVTDKLTDMGYNPKIFPIYEVRAKDDTKEPKTAPFLSNLCVENLAAAVEVQSVVSRHGDEISIYPAEGTGELGGPGRAKQTEPPRRDTQFKGMGASGKTISAGGSRSKRNRKGSRGGGRKRKNKRSKKRKYMRSKKRKKLQRR